MNVSSISAQASLQATQVQTQVQRSGGGDPDGGADRARELAAQQPATDTVHISSQAQQALGLAGDPDHGADGK